MEHFRLGVRLSVRCDMDQSDEPDPAYVDRLRRSMRGAIGFARRRQAKREMPAPVDLTLDEIMEVLRRQNYRCAISGLMFWSGSTVAYGPTIPSIDRLTSALGYTRDNVRVVLLGVNGLRGAGTDDDMMMIARAVVQNGPAALRSRRLSEGARKAWVTRRATAKVG